MTTMPDARRLARKSIHLLTGLGMSKPDACRLVVIVADEAAAAVWRSDPEMDLTWLADIVREARALGDSLQRHRPAGPPAQDAGIVCADPLTMLGASLAEQFRL